MINIDNLRRITIENSDSLIREINCVENAMISWAKQGSNYFNRNIFSYELLVKLRDYFIDGGFTVKIEESMSVNNEEDPVKLVNCYRIHIEW